MDNVTVNTDSFYKFAADCERAAMRFRMSMPVEMSLAGQAIGNAVRGKAGWSHRIPAAVHVEAVAGTVKISVDGAAAPEAAPLEHRGREGTFKHPVFGHEWTVDQEARPFLKTTFDARRAVILLGARRSVLDGLREIHSHY